MIRPEEIWVFNAMFLIKFRLALNEIDLNFCFELNFIFWVFLMAKKVFKISSFKLLMKFLTFFNSNGNSMKFNPRKKFLIKKKP